MVTGLHPGVAARPWAVPSALVVVDCLFNIAETELEAPQKSDHAALPIIRHALCPPNPKLFERMRPTEEGRASLAT